MLFPLARAEKIFDFNPYSLYLMRGWKAQKGIEGAMDVGQDENKHSLKWTHFLPSLLSSQGEVWANEVFPQHSTMIGVTSMMDKYRPPRPGPRGQGELPRGSDIWSGVWSVIEICYVKGEGVAKEGTYVTARRYHGEVNFSFLPLPQTWGTWNQGKCPPWYSVIYKIWKKGGKINMIYRWCSFLFVCF